MDLLFSLLIGQGARLLFRRIYRPLTRLGHAIQDFWRGLGTGGWYLTDGKVEGVSVQAAGNLWGAVLSYSYVVEGEYWAGTIYRHFAVENDADEYAAQHPPGSIVVVRYRPQKVGKSVVLKSDQRATFHEVGI